MKKIVFIAVIGFTGQQTRDGRVLVAPEKNLIRHGDYPLPVYEKTSPLRQIGIVEQVALCDRRIIAFGRLDPDLVDQDTVKMIRAGGYHFGFDVDQVEYQQIHPEDAFLYYDGSVRVIDWRIRALVLEDVYDVVFDQLPRVVVEELEFKPREGEIIDVGIGKASLLGL